MTGDGGDAALHQARDALLEAGPVLVTTHLDYDGIAAGLALASALEQHGKTARVLVGPDAPDLSFLPGVERLAVGTGAPPHPRYTGTPGLVVAVDASTPDRGYGWHRYAATVVRTLNIDHHLSNTRFADVNLIDATAVSAGQVVLPLIRALGCSLTGEILTLLFASLCADAGDDALTDPAAIHFAAFLIDAAASTGGFDASVLYSRVQRRISLDQVPLFLAALSPDNLSTAHGGRLLVCMVPSDVAGQGVAPDVAAFVPILQRFASWQVLLVFSRDGDSTVVRVRCQPGSGFDAVEICDLLVADRTRGGGHVHRASARMRGVPAAVRTGVLERLDPLFAVPRRAATHLAGGAVQSDPEHLWVPGTTLGAPRVTAPPIPLPDWYAPNSDFYWGPADQGLHALDVAGRAFARGHPAPEIGLLWAYAYVSLVEAVVASDPSDVAPGLAGLFLWCAMGGQGDIAMSVANALPALAERGVNLAEWVGPWIGSEVARAQLCGWGYTVPPVVNIDPRPSVLWAPPVVGKQWSERFQYGHVAAVDAHTVRIEITPWPVSMSSGGLQWWDRGRVDLRAGTEEVQRVVTAARVEQGYEDHLARLPIQTGDVLGLAVGRRGLPTSPGGRVLRKGQFSAAFGGVVDLTPDVRAVWVNAFEPLTRQVLSEYALPELSGPRGGPSRAGIE